MPRATSGKRGPDATRAARQVGNDSRQMGLEGPVRRGKPGFVQGTQPQSRLGVCENGGGWESGRCSHGSRQTPSLPVPRPANDATREKQIPFRKVKGRPAKSLSFYPAHFFPDEYPPPRAWELVIQLDFVPGSDIGGT